jgi:anaerobic magnesium-protoporphyrin IX monomethyl ester cyclase
VNQTATITDEQTDVLLIFPKLGTWDDIVRDLPLSVIYAATATVKAGYRVKVLDLRFSEEDWQADLRPTLDAGCALVGISVMTGNPVAMALEVSTFVKANYPHIPVVWGGPHPTTLPEQTLENPLIDYVIRDGGSEPLAGLVDFLRGGSTRKEDVRGLAYRDGDETILNAPQTEFEILDHRDIPYDLIDVSGSNYNRLNSGELSFPIFMSAGCPYQCTFCVSPLMYKKINGKKWVGYGVDEILEHISYLAGRFEFTRIQVYDDESFINLEMMREVLEGWIERGYHNRFKLDFRGMRFNDVARMDDDYLQLMSDAGVEYMFMGLESGSPRMLKAMKKSFKVESAIAVNQRMAKFPKLKPHYNFFCGCPGETYESLLQTKEVLLQLVKDNPYCYLGHGGHWKPIPGTEITNVAVEEHGLELPTDLAGWALIDTLDLDATPPDYSWYNDRMYRMIKLLTLAGMLLDAKTKDLIGNLHPVLSRLAHGLIIVYRPLLRARLHYNFSRYLIEMKVYNFAIGRLGSFLKHKFDRSDYARRQKALTQARHEANESSKSSDSTVARAA